MRRRCQDRHWYLPLDLPLIVGKERRPKQQALPKDAALFIGRDRHVDGNFPAPNLDFCLLCVTQVLEPLGFFYRSRTRASHQELAIVLEIPDRRGVCGRRSYARGTVSSNTGMPRTLPLVGRRMFGTGRCSATYPHAPKVSGRPYREVSHLRDGALVRRLF